MGNQKLIDAVVDMELQLLGIAYQLKQNKNIEQATTAIERVARRAKSISLTMAFRNSKADDIQQKLTTDNKN